MKKIFKILGIVLLVAVFVGTFVFLYQKSRPEEQQFDVIEVTRADIHRSTIVTGTIEPRVEVDVKPQISGIVAEIYKRSGATRAKRGTSLRESRWFPTCLSSIAPAIG